jgi:hypothetical protein
VNTETVLLLYAAMTRGRLVELNGWSGGATGWAEIWRNKGGIAVPSIEDERLSQAYYVFRNTERIRVPSVAVQNNAYKIFLNCMCILMLTVVNGKLMRRSTYIVCLCCLSGYTVFIHDLKSKQKINK